MSQSSPAISPADDATPAAATAALLESASTGIAEEFTSDPTETPQQATAARPADKPEGLRVRLHAAKLKRPLVDLYEMLSKNAPAEPKTAKPRVVTVGKGRFKSPKSASQPKSITARDRLDNPDHAIKITRKEPQPDGTVAIVEETLDLKAEGFREVNGKLFCGRPKCKHEVSLNSTVIKGHVNSRTHKDGEQVAAEQKQESDANQRLIQGMTKQGVHGQVTVSMDVKQFRLETVKSLLGAGVAMGKMSKLRAHYERYAYSLCEPCQLAYMHPSINSKEKEAIKVEIAGQWVSSIYDEASHHGQIWANILRWVPENLDIEMRLIRAKQIATSMNAQQQCQLFTRVNAVEYQVQPENLVAVPRDGCSTNGKTARCLKQSYFEEFIDVICGPHTLVREGGYVATPHLDTFISAFSHCFTQSFKARRLWCQATNDTATIESENKFWSTYNVWEDVFNNFSMIPHFIKILEEEDCCPALCKKMCTFFPSSPQLATQHSGQSTINEWLLTEAAGCELSQKAVLMVELAVGVDACKPLVDATAVLESDGAVILTAYDTVIGVGQHYATKTYPNLRAVSDNLSKGNQVVFESLYQYGLKCVEPMAQYHKNKFSEEAGEPLAQGMAAMKAARYLNPARLHQVYSTTDALIEALKIFPPIKNSQSILDGLVKELPDYLALAQGCQLVDHEAMMKWWKGIRNQSKLPTWRLALRTVVAVPVSSAAAERMFSLLRNTFGDQQSTIMEDYLENSLMAQYNWPRRKVENYVYATNKK